jgi:NADH-quinone oxidoreductase subunit A
MDAGRRSGPDRGGDAIARGTGSARSGKGEVVSPYVPVLAVVPSAVDPGGAGVNPYVPILALLALGAGFAVVSIVAGALTGPSRYNKAKLDAYECGIQPTPHATGGGRFPIKYYLVAMLFIVFDIESVFLIPFAVSFDQLGLFSLVEMVLFIGTVFAAYAYVWRRGGLEWD